MSGRNGLKFFDEFLQADKPRKLPGIDPIKVTYGEAWESSLTRPLSQSTQITGTQEDWMISTWLPSLQADTDGRVVLDVEHYGWGNRNSFNAATVADSKAKMLQYINICKAQRPDLRFSFYAVGPARDYWRAKDDDADRVEWQEDNREFQEVIDAQAELDPSLYTFYADQVGNADYINANIAEAKINAKGKPIHVLIWPYFHQGGEFPDSPLIGHEYWRRIMDNVRDAGADGIIFWGGFRRPWAEMRVIYDVIKRFVRDWHG